MKLSVQVDKENVYPEMGCYGIGISRVVAASIEQNFDEKGIVWPEEISPFDIVLVEINPRNDKELKSSAQNIYETLLSKGHKVLWDDREQSPGVKFSDMELIGIPKMIILGEKSFKENKVELKIRSKEGVSLIDIIELEKYL